MASRLVHSPVTPSRLPNRPIEALRCPASCPNLLACLAIVPAPQYAHCADGSGTVCPQPRARRGPQLRFHAGYCNGVSADTAAARSGAGLTSHLHQRHRPSGLFSTPSPSSPPNLWSNLQDSYLHPESLHCRSYKPWLDYLADSLNATLQRWPIRSFDGQPSPIDLACQRSPPLEFKLRICWHWVWTSCTCRRISV